VKKLYENGGHVTRPSLKNAYDDLKKNEWQYAKRKLMVVL